MSRRLPVSLVLVVAGSLALGLTRVQAQGTPITTASRMETTSAGLSARNVPGPDSDTIIHPDDVLDISILDVPDLSRLYRVSPGGTIMLPLVPQPLHAAGMRVTDFSGTVAKELHDRGLVTNAEVVVSIASSRAESVAITGAVKMPQIYPVFGETTLLDILSQAQGLTDDASNLAIITRGESAMQSLKLRSDTETVDLTKLLQSGDASYNVKIYAGDRVTIPHAGIVYVVGAVNKPGGYTIKSASQGLTVLQAIALAEDAKSTAKKDKTIIIRTDPTAPGSRRKIPLDLKQVLAGKTPDPVLQANDILFVPDSQGAKALRRGLEAALQTATGVAVYRPW